jgi:hypothetical protein
LGARPAENVLRSVCGKDLANADDWLDI